MGWLEKWEGGLYQPVVMVIVLVLCAIPYIMPLGLPIPIGEDARTMYRDIEALPEGSIVLLHGPTGPSSYGDVGYGFEAFFAHLMRSNMRVVIFSPSSVAAPMYTYALNRIKDVMQDKVYGEDYAYYGFIINAETEWSIIANDFKGWQNNDYYGTPITEVPLLNEINDINDFDAIVATFFGTINAEGCVRQVGSVYTNGNIYILAGGAVYPYAKAYSPEPFKSVLFSLRGSAEYEYLLRRPRRAIVSMDSQSIMLTLFAVLGITGNILGYTLKQRKIKGGLN
ncbi:MAG: hypothetical protein ACFFDT_00650 [Candidatus Hodarchaeota archaeon]